VLPVAGISDRRHTVPTHPLVAKRLVPGNLSDQPNQDRPDGKAGWDSGNKVSFVAAISLGVESRLLYIKWHWHLVLRAKRFLTELPLTSRQVVKWNKTQFE